MADKTLIDDLNETWDKLAAEPADAAPEADEVDEPVEEEAASAEDGGDAEATEDLEESGADEEISAPDEWPDEAKERFASLSPEDREFMVNRYRQMTADYTTKTQELARERTELDAIRPVAEFVKGYEQQIRMMGQDPLDYVKQLFAISRNLQSDPAGTLQMLARSAGVDLTSLTPAEEEYQDPQIESLTRKIGQLEQRLAAAPAESNLQAQIAAFRDAKDAAGSLIHPHFERVRQVMGAFAQSTPDASLEDLYERAVWADSELREERIKAQLDAEKAKLTTARRVAAEKAKRETTSVSSTSPASEPKRKPAKSWEEELSRVWDELSAR